MAKIESSGEPLICRQCQGPLIKRESGYYQCERCAQIFDMGHFEATGVQAVGAQENILADYNRAITIRTLLGYTASVAFAMISAALIVWAPEHRVIAANIVAGAFLVLAVGLAGFTRFKASAPGFKMDADTRRSK